MTREARLSRELRILLCSCRIAALGTVSDSSAPFVSMVPFAVQPTAGYLVIHVSGLAAHTRHMQKRSQVSLLIMQPEAPGVAVHDLPRVTLNGAAILLDPGSDDWRMCRAAYLDRFPEAEPMTGFGDFRFAAIKVNNGRQIAGFGAARDVDAQEIQRVMSLMDCGPS
ncbi:pyridoxamine 5'-phosphate oxidase [Candidimonas sp. SYP-B2681]|uniref:HugZ family pyridoxamine 5'-phosphate oxidase n=1 Tax=Candidimonas sp. SYP-B2681 TaxID=2497686 RepID=UPI000F869FEA|nr:pyridoxamine 5'-phosphate oxidase family protein [Candidimonas sp. SYP-B2681]RTZ44728.1 pyridoxamine 5'-phosphate oxidase [Candidimonas sp. SYP-B2681]